MSMMPLGGFWRTVKRASKADFNVPGDGRLRLAKLIPAQDLCAAAFRLLLVRGLVGVVSALLTLHMSRATNS
jgi:hypothetical protein